MTILCPGMLSHDNRRLLHRPDILHPSYAGSAMIRRLITGTGSFTGGGLHLLICPPGRPVVEMPITMPSFRSNCQLFFFN